MFGSILQGFLGARGAEKAGRAEEAAAQAAIDLQRETRDIGLRNLSPFMMMGQGALEQFRDTAMTELDPTQFFNSYFESPEYAMMSDQARRNMLAGQEAAGGLRTTSTANLLGSIAPQLANNAFARQQALQDANYNRQLGMVNIGMNAAGGSNAIGGNAANNIGSLLMQQGQATAGRRAAPFQAASNVLGDLQGMLMKGMGGF